LKPLTNDLEDRLAEEMVMARERATRSAEATGAQFVEGSGRLGFTPTSIRTKKGAMFKDEMAQVKSALDEVINDVMKSTSFADNATRAKKQIELQERAGQVQKLLVETGVQADLQIASAKLAQQEKNAMYNAFAGIASSIGFGIARGRKGGGGAGAGTGGGGGIGGADAGAFY
jgi:hypothetical protein